jgi:hypothetical protein
MSTSGETHGMIPPSMREELTSFSPPVDLAGWTQASGTFALAVGYMQVFWRDFVLVDDLIVPAGTTRDEIALALGETPGDVELMLNHVHLAHLQWVGAPDISEDKLVFLGERLRDMWLAKLAWLFPDRPCLVEFIQPDVETDWLGYQVWVRQMKHRTK